MFFLVCLSERLSKADDQGRAVKWLEFLYNQIKVKKIATLQQGVQHPQDSFNTAQHIQATFNHSINQLYLYGTPYKMQHKVLYRDKTSNSKYQNLSGS